MRILHCCLAIPYIDNYGYQENIITKMHKLQGHEVKILASTETYLNNKKIGYVESGSYTNEHDIPVKRVSYIDSIPNKIVKKLRIYKGIKDAIKSFKPDIIFIHGCQFLSIRAIALYAKENPDIKIYVDNHADFINSATNWISKNILHGIIYRHCAKIIEPYTTKFYGVLPARVDFLRDLYKLPSEKIELLVMGVDDSNIDFKNKCMIRESVRKELNILEEDFVIVTGGKIDRRKNIPSLMQAVIDLNLKHLKLIIFGTPSEEMEEEILALSGYEGIISVGWIQPESVYDYYFASDLAIFPGTHSALWEQAVGVGLPAVFKRWEGMQHIDLGGNCLFLETGDAEEIKASITRILENEQQYTKMKRVARTKGIEYFSYDRIARTSIESSGKF